MFKDKKPVVILSQAAILLWMVVIFNLSAQPATQSDQLSKGITKVIVQTVQKVTPGMNMDINQLNHIVRKNAHFFAYMVLGLLVINAMRRSGVSNFKAFAFSLAICVLYAMSDEVHQIYVPGRGAQVRDVLIDSSGSLMGLFIWQVVQRLGHRHPQQTQG